MSIIKSYILPHPPLIIEEIGKGKEEIVNKTIDSYKEVSKEIKKIKPETIVIISPHTTMYSDWFHIISSETITGNLKEYGVDIEFNEENDLELINTFDEIVKKEKFPAEILKKGNQYLDHGEMVPLYFIEKELKKFKVMIIGLSGLPLIKHYELGIYLNKAIEKLNRKVVLIASGDLSHTLKEDGPYGYNKYSPIYEKEIEEIIKDGDFKKLMNYKSSDLEKIGDCGHRSFTIMAGCFNKKDIETIVYSHEDATGVGYLVGKITPLRNNEERDFLKQQLTEEKKRIDSIKEKEDEYIKLARKAIEAAVNNKEMEIERENYLDKAKNAIKDYVINTKDGIKNYPKLPHYGCFVSITKFNELRGCIGTIIPLYKKIEDEIIENAKQAATQDPRFPKITKDELDYLEIHVDILQKPTEAKSVYELDPKKYGIIVMTNEKKGVLLPNLDGVDDVDTQIEIALHKAGINDKEQYIIEKFEVERHEVK